MTGSGFGIFTTRPFTRLVSVPLEGSIGVCVPLPAHPELHAIVGGAERPASSCRDVVVVSCSRPQDVSIVATLRTTARILSVQASPAYITAVTSECVFVFSVSTWSLLFEVPTPPNPLGLCGLSPNAESPYIVVLASDTSARLSVINVLTQEHVCEIQAHRAPLRCCAVSPCGGFIATASTTGTLIRVFRLPDGGLSQTLRRGRTPASIACLHFFALPLHFQPGDGGPSSSHARGAHPPSLLAVGSDLPTVHIFRLVVGGPVLPPYLASQDGSIIAIPPTAPSSAAASALSAPVPSLASQLTSWAAHAVGGDGDRDWATIQLRSDAETPSTVFAVAADPPVAIAIAFVVYKLPVSVPPLDPVAAAQASDGAKLDAADWSSSPGPELGACYDDDGGWADLSPGLTRGAAGGDGMAASWLSLPAPSGPSSTCPPRPQPPRAEAACLWPASPMDLLRDAVESGSAPPPYVVTVVTRSGLALQYALDASAGGSCPLLEEHSADLAESVD